MRNPKHKSSDAMLGFLAEALDSVDFGFVVLDPAMRLRFANRRFRVTTGLPEQFLIAGTGMRDLIQYLASEGIYAIGPRDAADFAAAREAAFRAGTGQPSMLRLADGHELVCRAFGCPNGGRVITYTEISRLPRQEDAEAVERINAELRYNTEALEDHAAHLASLAEAAEDSAQRAEAARTLLEAEVAERRQLEAKLRELATTDALTGALNRAELMAVAAREHQQTTESGRAMSVLMIDADRFKRVNDHYGHAAGDRALQHMVTLVAGVLRNTDTVGRLGGEEFVVLLPGSDVADAERVAERLRSTVEASPVTFKGMAIPLTISIGLAGRQPTDPSIESVIARADEALYLAKKTGRNRVVRADLPPALTLAAQFLDEDGQRVELGGDESAGCLVAQVS